MAAALDDLEPGVRQRRQETVRRREGNNLVLVAPGDENRRFHTRQQMWEGLAVHVGLPRDAETHLARNIPSLELVGRGFGAIDLVECFLIVESGTGVVDVADDGLVENIAFGRLDA